MFTRFARSISHVLIKIRRIEMESLTILIRVVAAAFLSGLIGWEREVHGCVAGLRTHMLVCVGSTMFMVTSIMISAHYGHVGDADISRIAAGVVTGIGFLGAGTVIRAGGSVRGLTTAASIWTVAAIGLAAGIGMYAAAGITTAVVLAVLIISRTEGVMGWKKHAEKLMVTVDVKSDTGTVEIKNIIEMCGGKIKQITSDVDEPRNRKDLTLDIILARFYRTKVVAEIAALSGVKKVTWE